MRNTDRGITRRRLLQASAGSLGLAALCASPVFAANGSRIAWLALRYRTDAKRIARLLPPPLEPDDVTEVLVDYASLTESGGEKTIIRPGDISCFAVHVAAKYKGQRGMLRAGMAINQDWGRIVSRELVGGNAKDGAITLERSGNRVKASFGRRGAPVHRVETVVTDRSAHPLYSWRETGYGAFVFRYRLNPAWAKSMLDEGSVELWRVEGSDGGYPVEQANGAQRPVECDISRTEFEWVRPSALDPYIEFPVREFLGASFYETSGRDLLDLRRRVESTRSVFLQDIRKRSFEPWALLNYDRPVQKRKPWRPNGWPGSRTAFKLTAAEISQYKSRKEIDLGPMAMIDIRLAIDPAIHAQILPSPCRTAPRSLLRILGMRVEASDISPEPFQEVWLLASCRVGSQLLWYSLSHIVTPGGDVLDGRETFGYPSVNGEVNVVVTPEHFSLRGRRLGREFVYAEGRLRGSAAGISLGRVATVGLRAPPFGRGRNPPAQLVSQPWYFQGRYLRIDPRSFVLELPSEAAPGRLGRPTPWFEFRPFQNVSAVAAEDVGMQRGPGRIVEAVDGFEPYYAQRCDGVLPGRPVPDEVQPTFRVRRPRTVRSDWSIRGTKVSFSGQSSDASA